VAFVPYIYAISGFIHTFSLVTATLSHNIPRGQLPDAISAFNVLGRSFSPLSPIIGGIAFSASPALPLMISSILMPIPLFFLVLLYREEKRTKQLTATEEDEPVPSPIEEMRPGL
jgi:hypothetical protein